MHLDHNLSIMSDMPDAPGREEGGANIVSMVVDQVLDSGTAGVAPFARNLLKVIARLTTAALDIPTAKLEGVAAEIRATTKARIKLTETTTRKLSTALTVAPEYAFRAGEMNAQKIVRAQLNVDAVVETAARELSNDVHKQDEKPVEEISDDWLNAFESHAAMMSSEKMQHLFGKILAGEIRKPASFSIKTVNLLAQLDNQAAKLFRTLCSLATTVIFPGLNTAYDARVVAIKNAHLNGLEPFGLSFDQLNLLQEYGLIISDYASSLNYAPTAEQNVVHLPIHYQGAEWTLTHTDPTTSIGDFNVLGVALTRSGKELLPVIDIEPNAAYTAALEAYYLSRGLNFMRRS